MYLCLFNCDLAIFLQWDRGSLFDMKHHGFWKHIIYWKCNILGSVSNRSNSAGINWKYTLDRQIWVQDVLDQWKMREIAIFQLSNSTHILSISQHTPSMISSIVNWFYSFQINCHVEIMDFCNFPCLSPPDGHIYKCLSCLYHKLLLSLLLLTGLVHW